MTFVIACYDLPADMLRECVTAIFSLAFQPGEREVIVIDDGSKLPAITDIDDAICFVKLTIRFFIRCCNSIYIFDDIVFF